VFLRKHKLYFYKTISDMEVDNTLVQRKSEINNQLTSITKRVEDVEKMHETLQQSLDASHKRASANLSSQIEHKVCI